mmetsp:Transcript_25776/g.43209  ORF Transcript_25776/g.43209 Transcript_25776/m.43209 type:complete len:121 (-) Transcript_25776:101-463(-)
MARLDVHSQVIRVYRHCLQSAARCPSLEQRNMMKAYVRMSFEHSKIHLTSEKQIADGLARGEEQVERMNYYHTIYAEKQRISAEQLSHAKSRPLVCSSCVAAYPSASSKFCSECGLRREP